MYLRKIARYKFSSICIMCFFVFAYLTFYYGAYEKLKVNNENYDIDKYSYENSQMYSVASDAGDKVLTPLLDMEVEDAYISIADFTVYIDSILASALVQVEISGENLRDYPLISGYIANNNSMNHEDRTAVVGKDIKKYTDSRNGYDYITILGEEYKVTGYLAASNSGIFDNTILLLSNNLGDNFIKALKVGLYSGNVSVCTRSNTKAGMDAFINRIEELADTNEIYFQKMPDSNFYSTEVKPDSYKKTMMLIYIFCVISIIFSVELWIFERNKEISIRKTYGESMPRIVYRIYKELFILLSISGIIAVIFQIVIDLCMREVMAYSLSKTWFMIQNLVICVVVTSIIAMIKPIHMILLYKPKRILDSAYKR